MKALICEGPGKITLVDKPKPALQMPGDTMVCITLTTICGTDLRIIKDDVSTCEPGRTLGHEGVDVVELVGATVISLQQDGHVLTSCTSSCGKCVNCRRGIYSHCETGGWTLGHRIDGVQVEYVRTPYTETSLYKLPPGVDEKALVMLSDILPTGFKYGVLSSRVQPGNSVAITGTGPIGLASLLTAQFYSPAQIIMIDTNAARLEVAGRLGAIACIDVSREDVVAAMKRLTDDVGVDCAIEAVGVPAMLELCQQLVAPGGVIVSIGVHSVKTDLHLKTLWSQNIAITTRLVDTTSMPMLLKTVHTGRLLPGQLTTYRFRPDDVLTACNTFCDAARTQALKVIIFVQAATHARWIFYFARWMP